MKDTIVLTPPPQPPETPPPEKPARAPEPRPWRPPLQLLSTSTPGALKILAVVTATMALLVLVRHCVVGFADLADEVADHRSRGLVLRAGGGDVGLRDIPKAHDILAGRFFGDPYYAGEPHWYPFAMPLMAAAVTGVGVTDVPEAFFHVEILMIAAYLGGLGLLAFVVARWAGVIALPCFVWLGWLTGGNGLYPGESARGMFCAFLAYAAVVASARVGGARRTGPEQPGSLASLRPGSRTGARRAFLLGLAVGTLGLWHGASLVVAGVVLVMVGLQRARAPLPPATGGDVVAAEATVAGGGRWKRRLGYPLLALLGVALPLSLLFGPQLAHYGTVQPPGAARYWLADIYQGGSLGDVLRLKLAPRGVPALLVAMLVVRFLVRRRLELPRWPRLVPLVTAYLVCLAVAHTGFVLAGQEAAAVRAAPILRALLPAPPHTFHLLASACLPAVMAAGVLAALEIAGALIRRTAWWDATSLRQYSELSPVATRLVAVFAYTVLLATFPYEVQRYAGAEPLEFDRQARRLGQIVGTRPVFFRHPARFVQSTSLKILLVSVDEYGNHYVQRERRRAVAAIDDALTAGQTTTADELLARYQIAYVVEDPRYHADPVVRRCGGEKLLDAGGYLLRPLEKCRP